MRATAYGPAFISIAIYEPRDVRKNNLKRAYRDTQESDVAAVIAELMGRDEEDEDALGQRVQAAFDLADFIVDATLPDKEIKSAIDRLVHLLFGDLYLTPSLAVERMKKRGITISHDDLQSQDVDAIVKFLWEDEQAPLRTSKLADTIDYIRAVHAEMAAITDAARHGSNLKGATLYTTTFPCHDCSKHIVATGIKRVCYLAPYPKSLTSDLFEDSIEIDSHLDAHRRKAQKVIFRSFVGVAPSRYLDFFTVGKRARKDRMGRPTSFDISGALPVLPQSSQYIEAMLNAEKFYKQQFDAFTSAYPGASHNALAEKSSQADAGNKLGKHTFTEQQQGE